MFLYDYLTATIEEFPDDTDFNDTSIPHPDKGIIPHAKTQEDNRGG